MVKILAESTFGPMIEQIILFAIIIALLVYHYFYAKQVKEERKDLMNAIIAKNAQELRDLTLAGNTQIKVDPPKEPDLEPLENVTDDRFMKALLEKKEVEQ